MFVLAVTNEHMKPYSEDSKFWTQLWLASGKPREGQIFTNMRVSKRQFKFAVRKLKRCQDKIRNENSSNACLQMRVMCSKKLRSFVGNRGTLVVALTTKLELTPSLINLPLFTRISTIE